MARPNAHGHDITSTDIQRDSAKSKLWPDMSHTAAVISDSAITTGTKIPLMRSASLAIGAFEFPASSTSLIIPASVVLSPTFDARKWNVPFLFIVADMTLSPGFFSTGMLSPVIAD